MLLKASGAGDIFFFNTYGGLIEIEVDGDYAKIGFIVAFESTLQYETTWLSGLKRGSGLKNLSLVAMDLSVSFVVAVSFWVQTGGCVPVLAYTRRYKSNAVWTSGIEALAEPWS